MKKSLFRAALLIVLGLVFVFAALLVRFNVASLDAVKYQTNTHTVSEAFTKIVIDTGTCDVEVLPTDEAAASVICHEREKEIHAVTVRDQTLLVQLQDTRAWYDHISVFDFGAPKITVLLPRATYEALQVTATTSDVMVKDTTVGELTVSTTAGDVMVKDTTIGELTVSTTTGDIFLEAAAVVGEARLSVTTGEVALRRVTCGRLTASGTTGDFLLHDVLVAGALRVSSNTGDVTLEACDAETLYIETSTGDIEGSLLTEKQFLVTSNTGEIEVPRGTTGGLCEAKTSTGDIEFVIKAEKDRE